LRTLQREILLIGNHRLLNSPAPLDKRLLKKRRQGSAIRRTHRESDHRISSLTHFFFFLIEK